MTESGHEVVVFHTTANGKPVSLTPANVSSIQLDLPAEDGHAEKMANALWRHQLHAPLVGFVYFMSSKTTNEMIDKGSYEVRRLEGIS